MIHKYFLNGYYIVIDTNSGAVHIVDELAYRLLDFFTEKLKGECPEEIISTLVNEGFDKQDIIDTYAELKALCDDDSLFSEDTYRPFADMLTEAPIKSMCLNISHDCNLRCEYCFAAQGDFGHGRKLMPFEVGKAAIDFLIKHSANRHNLELDFFGGEPLMMMCSDLLKVGLVTVHIPVSAVSASISKEGILSKLRALRHALIQDFSVREPRIAVLSLNPHAGDGGLIGQEEEQIIAPAIQAAFAEKILAFGPFPADGFFAAAAYRKYDAVLAMYHLSLIHI